MRYALALFILIAGCGKVDGNLVSGFDAEGNRVKERPLDSKHACPLDISEFEKACIKAGYKTILLHDCSVICSGKIESDL